MVQKINPHPAQRCNRSPHYYVFSKDAFLGSVPFISSEVLDSSHEEIIDQACGIFWQYWCWIHYKHTGLSTTGWLFLKGQNTQKQIRQSENYNSVWNNQLIFFKLEAENVRLIMEHPGHHERASYYTSQFLSTQYIGVGIFFYSFLLFATEKQNKAFKNRII